MLLQKPFMYEIIMNVQLNHEFSLLSVSNTLSFLVHIFLEMKYCWLHCSEAMGDRQGHGTSSRKS